MKFEEIGDFLTFAKCDKCFVYFLIKDEEVVYVGKTNVGLSRPLSHKDKEYDYIKVLPCNPEKLDETEDFYICKYKPEYNKLRNYNVVFSIKRTKDIIKKNYDSSFNLPKLKRLLSKLNIVPFYDEYAGCSSITIKELNEIKEYFERNTEQ